MAYTRFDISSRITAADHFTNTATGVVDGINTRIQATRIDNAGGLYGDVLRLGAETVNNTASGAIAARDILKIGAHDINNTDGALIYSGGALEADGNPLGINRKLGCGGPLPPMSTRSWRIAW